MPELSNRERMAIPRHEMPTQEPEARAANFDEVALGYTWELAQQEAERCLQCAKPRCVDGCPVGVLIPQFIQALRDGDMAATVRAMQEKNNLPAICGRVCPQESQCEANCVLAKKGQAVAIGRLERFIGDFEVREHSSAATPAPSTGRKVAVVGSGPAGLTCAVDLAKLGHKVVIFESLHLPGGVLIYGIPKFRLPKSIIRAELEVAAKNLGIEIRTDHVIGNTYTLDELLNEYDAVFMGTGAGLPSFMRIPGINLNGVMSANEFLTRVNLMKGYRFPEYDTPVKVGQQVAVVGAGNVAMDAARSALRLQIIRARHNGGQPHGVHIVYRRSRHEVPAREEEFHHAEEEGVICDFLTDPIAILGDEKGAVPRCAASACSWASRTPPDAGHRCPSTAPSSRCRWIR